MRSTRRSMPAAARLALGAAIASAALMAVAMAASLRGVHSRALLQDNQCVQIGLTLQSACANELKEGTQFFGINSDGGAASLQQAGGISSDAVSKYLAQAKPPSAECCKASCQFNSQLCSCDPGITALISSYTGNNLAAYNAVAQAVSKACGFTPYVGDTCPANAASKPKPYGKACA